jgi:hypothetical protein
MAQYEFNNPGAVAGAAIQDFLMKRAIAERQAMLDQAAAKQRDIENARADAAAKFQEKQQAFNEQLRRDQLAEVQRQHDEANAARISTEALPGDLADAETQRLLNETGRSGQLIPGSPETTATKFAGLRIAPGAPDTAGAENVPAAGISGVVMAAPPSMRGGANYLAARQAAEERAAAAKEAAQARADQAERDRQLRADQAERDRQMRREIAALAHSAADNGLVKVETKGPNGEAIVEYLPKSEVRGKTFEKPAGQTVQNRLESAKAVQQTGQDIINKLSDPAYAKQVGVVLGRYNTLQDFVGNPPPEFADLAGNIESYALANMGVHGMRSVQGSEKIKALLSGKHTPESIIAAVKGLNNFSEHFMENNGMKTSSSQADKAGKVTVTSIKEIK